MASRVDTWTAWSFPMGFRVRNRGGIGDRERHRKRFTPQPRFAAASADKGRIDQQKWTEVGGERRFAPGLPSTR